MRTVDATSSVPSIWPNTFTALTAKPAGPVTYVSRPGDPGPPTTARSSSTTGSMPSIVSAVIGTTASAVVPSPETSPRSRAPGASGDWIASVPTRRPGSDSSSRSAAISARSASESPAAFR